MGVYLIALRELDKINHVEYLMVRVCYYLGRRFRV